MNIKEEIVKSEEGYIVKTEVKATEEELKQHLTKIKGLVEGYNKEIKDLDTGIVLTEEQQKLKENLDVLDEVKILELHKSKIGNVEKRINDLKEAIETVSMQVENREKLFEEEKKE